MSAELTKLFRAFENALFAYASDEYNERASHPQIKKRYDLAQDARAALYKAIEDLEKKVARRRAMTTEELSERARIAARIMAGFCANPAIFAYNPNCGWSLVNATDEQVAGYAVKLADEIIKANK